MSRITHLTYFSSNRKWIVIYLNDVTHIALCLGEAGIKEEREAGGLPLRMQF